MIYINTKTGAVIETDCTVQGGAWKPKPQQKSKPNKKTVKEK